MILKGYPLQPTKVIGLGKAYMWNYDGNLKVPDPLPEPSLFIRPLHALAPEGIDLEIPIGTSATYEVEFAIVIGKGGKNIKVGEAMNHVAGYALILDMSATNFQMGTGGDARTLPLCKGFDTFNPIGRFVDRTEVTNPHDVILSLEIDGEEVSNDSTSNLIYTIAQEIAFASGITTISDGDILLTGAAKGVSMVHAGSRMRASMVDRDGKELDSLQVDIVHRQGGFKGSQHWTEWIQ